MKKLCSFIKKETVLSIAVLLAVASMFFVHPDSGYLSYIDFRTLAILFCLMSIVAGVRSLGLFDQMAEWLLSRVHGIGGVTVILVCLCFFMSMLITNDVALITFVPFAIIIMKKYAPGDDRWMIKVVVMQTIAANLGSMLTPVGNPQNLYLYGKSGMGIGAFLSIMLPYSVIAFVMLMLWIVSASLTRMHGENKSVSVERKAQAEKIPGRTGKLIAYGILFIISVLSVSHILPYGVPFVLVCLYLVICDRVIFARIDYSLLGIFIALFIFIGNLGRIPVFCDMLSGIISGRETMTAVVASQVMSNVPAAILLSGFTSQIKELVIGTNLGGLGTLIASMASLISFKYIARENRTLRGRYFLVFTIANILFLAVLLVSYRLFS